MKITKLAENQVEVTPKRKIKDKNGKTFEVYDEDKKKQYGRKGVEEEKAAVQAQIDIYNDPKKLAQVIADLEARLSDLTTIEQALDE